MGRGVAVLFSLSESLSSAFLAFMQTWVDTLGFSGYPFFLYFFDDHPGALVDQTESSSLYTP